MAARQAGDQQAAGEAEIIAYFSSDPQGIQH
jgi:hypothetical protein